MSNINNSSILKNANNYKILNYVGSSQNFSKLFNFLSNKNYFYINNNSIKLPKRSFDQISNLANENFYTYITLIIPFKDDKIHSFSSYDQNSVDIIIDKEKYLYKNNFMVVDTNDNNEKKHKEFDFIQSKSEEEEEINSHSPLLSKKNSQNNNNTNEKDKKILNNKNNNKNKINIEILSKLKNQNFITHNYEDILIYWEVLFCLLIIIGFNIFIHIMSVIVNLRIILNFYIFYCFVLSGLLLYIGTFSLIKIQKDLEKEIVVNSIINELLILSIFLTFGVWIVICYLNKDLKRYILYQSYYNIIYISAILFEFFALIQNFMMNETYREYDYYLKKNKNNKDELKNINNNINNEILIN